MILKTIPIALVIVCNLALAQRDLLDSKVRLDQELPQSKLAAAEGDVYTSPEFPLGESARFELVNFVDAIRSVSDIHNALRGEYGNVSLEIVAKYFDDLVKIGVMRWK